MESQGKIRKWGNSSAIRLPAKILAAAGLTPDSDVDIQAVNGRVVIQLKQRTREQLFDKLLAEEPGAAELLKATRKCLAKAIRATDENTKKVNDVIEKLNLKEGS